MDSLLVLDRSTDATGGKLWVYRKTEQVKALATISRDA